MLANEMRYSHTGISMMDAPKAVSRCLSWGANSYGQLAQGHRDDILLPKEVCPQHFNLQDIIGGGGHSLFLCADGTCFSCGWNTKGQCGLGCHGDDVTEPAEIQFPSEVVCHLAAGWDFSAAITLSGKLFTWGSNAFGQLGLPDIKQLVSTPTQVTIPGVKNIIDAACGLRHSVILTDGGQVYSCGAARKGQLGVTSVSDDKPLRTLASFTQVPLPRDFSGHVIQVVAGAYHTGLLTRCGKVLLFGDNKHGQLTVGGIQQRPAFEVVNEEYFCSAKVIRLHSGWTHMLAETEDGKIYSWGRGDYGQLGRSVDGTFDPKPCSLPESCWQPQQVCCGAEHNMLITNVGEVLSWGWNEHGMCGSGDEENILTPSSISALAGQSVSRVACGSGHSFVVS